jgi:hypothetical protein
MTRWVDRHAQARAIIDEEQKTAATLATAPVGGIAALLAWAAARRPLTTAGRHTLPRACGDKGCVCQSGCQLSAAAAAAAAALSDEQRAGACTAAARVAPAQTAIPRSKRAEGAASPGG